MEAPKLVLNKATKAKMARASFRGMDWIEFIIREVVEMVVGKRKAESQWLISLSGKS
jgi:hypothetical protein